MKRNKKPPNTENIFYVITARQLHKLPPETPLAGHPWPIYLRIISPDHLLGLFTPLVGVCSDVSEGNAASHVPDDRNRFQMDAVRQIQSP